MAQRNDLRKRYLQLKENTELIFELLLPDNASSLEDFNLIEAIITKNTPHDEDLLDWAEKLIENKEFVDLNLNISDPLLLILVVIRTLMNEKRHQHDATSMDIILGNPTNKM